MENYLLVVDDRNEIEALVHLALAETKFRILAVQDVLSAKRKLVAMKPQALLCRLVLGDDNLAGAKLCAELRAHEAFSDLPVVLFVDATQGEAVALEHAIAVPWPINEKDLQSRLALILPGIKAPPPQNDSPELLPHLAFAGGAETAASAQPAPKARVPVSPDSELDVKVKVAQRLLAQVLHDLKTSDLLLVADEEDIPRMVFEMCRTVCGFSSEPLEEKTELREDKDDTDDGVEVDLDKIFGPKRS